MKVRVLKKFRDKREKMIRYKDDIFECSEERFAEIFQTDKSLVEAVEEQSGNPNEENPEVAPVQPEDQEDTEPEENERPEGSEGAEAEENERPEDSESAEPEEVQPEQRETKKRTRSKKVGS